MNDSENKVDSMPETEDVKRQCAALQRQMTTLLLALVIVSGTLTVFLWRQTRYARRDLEAMKGPAGQMIQEFNRVRPVMDGFLARVVEFSRTHQDFAPILAKYPIAVSTTAPPAAATAPQPAAAPPAR